MLALAVAARLAGYRGVTAFVQFARRLSQEQLQAVGAFYSKSQQRFTAPSVTTRCPASTRAFTAKRWFVWYLGAVYRKCI